MAFVLLQALVVKEGWRDIVEDKGEEKHKNAPDKMINQENPGWLAALDSVIIMS